MLNNFFKNTLLLTYLCIFAQSCSEDQTYDKEKAVLAFSKDYNLEIDESLKNIEIEIPNQIQSGTHNASDYSSNQEIENYFFLPKQNKKNKFLNKSKQIWSGYRPAFKKRFVFEPAIINNTAYLLDAKGILSAYNLEDNKRIYKNRLFKRRYLKSYQTPKINYSNEKIYAIAGSNEIVAADAKTGKIIWKKTILSIPISKPTASENLVYITTNDNKTYALKTSNGDLAWVTSGVERPTAIFGSSAPIIHENKLIVTYASGEIYALNKENGEILWSKSLNQNRAVDSDFYLNDIDATPIIRNNTIYAIGNGGLMMAININNGNYIWRKELASISDFWAASGFLYLIDNENRLIAIQQKDGAIKFISQLPEYRDDEELDSKIIYNGLIMAGDKLIISESRGRILVANPQNGKIEQTFKLKQKIFHSPIVINGKIILHAVGRYTINLIEIW